MKGKENNTSMSTGKFIWKLIMYKPLLSFSNAALWIIIQTSILIPGLVVKAIFDTFSNQSAPYSKISGLCIVLIVVAIVRVLIMYGGFRVDILHKFYTGSLLRKNMLKSILQEREDKLLGSLGEALNCIRDDTEEAENTFNMLIDSVGYAIFGLVSVGILLSINVRLTLLVFIPLVVILFIAKFIRQKVERYRKASRKAASDVVGAMGEIFNSVQAIQLVSAEKHILNHLGTLNYKRYKASLKDTILNQALTSIFDNVVNFGTALVLFFSAQAITSGSFTLGDFALFIYFLNYVTNSTTFIGKFITAYKQAGVSLGRMTGVLGEGSDDRLINYSELYLNKEVPIERHTYNCEESLENLEVKNLSYIYESSGRGIENISFKVKKNSFIVITGRIGSGKTTLLKAILGTLPMQNGEIYWNGERVENPFEFFVPPIAAYTSQTPNLISDTIKNNILLGMDEREVDINGVIHSAVLEEDIKTFEKGVETSAGPKGGKLSGGQRQRLAVARMYARYSQFYIIDDISSALDVETEMNLWGRLFDKTGVTCIAVSNRRIALQKADNIIVLKDGKVDSQGTLKELLDKSQEMREIW